MWLVIQQLVLVCLLGAVEFPAYLFCLGFPVFCHKLYHAVLCHEISTRPLLFCFYPLIVPFLQLIHNRSLDCFWRWITPRYCTDLVMSWEKANILQHSIQYNIWACSFPECVKAPHVKRKLFLWAVCVRMNGSGGFVGECAWHFPIDMMKVLVCPSSVLTQDRGSGTRKHNYVVTLFMLPEIFFLPPSLSPCAPDLCMIWDSGISCI